MPTQTVYPQAVIDWAPTDCLQFTDPASVEFATAGLLCFDFAPRLITFTDVPSEAHVLTADGEILTAEGAALNW